MKSMLGKQYDDFIKSYELSAYKGVRINTLKIPVEKASLLPFELERSTFADDSFYVKGIYDSFGTSPFHHSGGFYSQEPSASSAVTVLNPQKNDRVLDMCAAPGGKTTQIAAKLGGTGIIWANEYVRSRAQILISNIERMGIKNAVVSSAYPKMLAQRLEGFFNKVLVDAPCSGEGMFRKNPAAISEWSVEHTISCAERQQNILDCAARCLEQDGILVYSTCTFSPEENEQTVERFLQNHSDFVLEDIKVEFGTKSFLKGNDCAMLRIYPMNGGEGHFVARMRKTGESAGISSVYVPSNPNELTTLFKKEYSEIFNSELNGQIDIIGNNIYILPDEMPDVKGTGVLRAGVLAAEVKSKRIEPCHALFMAAKPEELKQIVDLTESPEKISAFLHGEEIEAESGLKGYCGVVFNGMTTGFGKCSGGRLKNRYPKGLRNLK